ncbi:MAG: hypothetical protein QOG62_1460 [Thermoleophilaceae bacterium]|nr:hypothetical protein [Thermoleophilaceae bacterium]
MLQASDRAPGLLLGQGVELPDDVVIGGNVVIHDGTVIGEGTTIQDGAILGKPVALGASSTATADVAEPLRIGAGAKICAGAIVLAGATVGPRALIGDQAHVRERSTIGEAAVVGRGTSVENDVSIGARTKIQTGCYITAFCVLEEDVFVAPGVFTTNDNTMGRHGAGYKLRGAILRRACRVGGAVVLLPGVEVGEEAFVAAGSVVTRDVPARSTVMGSPARVIREVPDSDLIERWT